MEYALISVCVCLLIFLIFIMCKYFSLKKNIRQFSHELEKLKDCDYRQPVKVSDFDKDIVELAVKVNEHTDIQRKLGDEYEQSKKQIGTVISGISHDFRTPLTASLGYLQMIEKSGELSPKNSEYLSVAMQKNKYLKELSDEFFDLTKLETNQEDLKYEDINLSNILTQTLLEHHDEIEEKGISSDFDIDEGIIVNTDPHYLERILSNLMSNAMKYTSDRLSVSLKTTSDGYKLTFSNTLHDTDQVDINRIFEPFYRMSARTEIGSGLGLYVVKMLCERLGWSVSAGLDDVFVIKIIIR